MTQSMTAVQKYLAYVEETERKRRRCKPNSEFKRFRRLTKEEVIEIRDLIDQGSSTKEVARKFHVSKRVVYLIHQRKVWDHV